jgi:WXG100 family type VII secretion target
MDVEAVERLAGQLEHQAAAIDGVVNHINSLVGQLQGVWKGHDATEFENWWNQQHRPALIHARDAINGLGQSAKNNAADQRNVSGH